MVSGILVLLRIYAPTQQEEIIEQALTSGEEVGLEEIKRIAGQVVFNNPLHRWEEGLD